jgi:hypothetical protein
MDLARIDPQSDLTPADVEHGGRARRANSKRHLEIARS